MVDHCENDHTSMSRKAMFCFAKLELHIRS
jgi:hypothetical protein